MKKCMLSLIALFVMGEMCTAQTLLSGRYLGADTGAGKTAVTRKTPARASEFINPAEATTYFVVSSVYGITGKFEPEGRNYSGYALKLEMPADGKSGEVTVTGICDLNNYEDVTYSSIKGEYDASSSTITIPTPFDSKYVGKCVKVGSYVRGGYDFTSVLAACKVADEPDMSGQYPINILDELVFDIAADGTLTPRSSWLIYGFSASQNGIVDLYNFTVGKPVTDDANVFALPYDVNFPENSVYVGTKAVENLYVVNAGRKVAACDYRVNGKGLQLAAYPSVNELSFNTFNVYLTADSEGEFSGTIEIKAEGGDTQTVPVKANVCKANDYNSIVRNGSFTFSLPEGGYIAYEPWVITDDVTDHPVALAQLDEMGSCGLDISMEVPAGKVGVFSWKGISHTQTPNGIIVVLDGAETVYSNNYSWDGYNAPHPADGYICVPEGKHTVTFEYLLDMDWYGMGLVDAPQRAYIWDLDLQTYDQKEELGALMDQTVDFGTWYLDKFICGASAEALILNLGSENLKVIGGDNSESFEVVGIGREVESMETLKALISFTGDRAGDYDEVVTVKTNGGDFKVRCVAKAEKIINDYQYLVTNGDISFGTSVTHPFTADFENKTAFSSTAKLNNVNDPDPDSWLSVNFVIPEGKQGKLSWTAFNSSNDLLQWLDEGVFTDGTQIYIDGVMVAEFAGICEASSADVDDSCLTFGAGRHSVKFNYVRKSTESDGNDDRVVISNIGLVLEESSVDSVDRDLIMDSEEYFTIEGIRVTCPENGIFIRKTVFSDGSVKTSKVVIR